MKSVAVAAILVAAAGVARAEDVAVKIDNFTYEPAMVQVKAGDTVTWTNHDDIPHTATASAGKFRSPVLDTEQKFSFTFTEPGRYEYFCALHPHMKAVVVVEPAQPK